MDVIPAEFSKQWLILNSFEMKIGQICGRAFYPVISRFNHSCLPNLSHVNLFNIGEPGWFHYKLNTLIILLFLNQ